jgi:hypothetical protein
MEREAHVLVESRDSTGISLKEESAIGLSRSGTQEDVSSIAENTLIVKQVRVSTGQV